MSQLNKRGGDAAFNLVLDPAPSQSPTIMQRYSEVRGVFFAELERILGRRFRARNMDPHAERSEELVFHITRSIWFQMGHNLYQTIWRSDHAARMNPFLSMTEFMDNLIIGITDGLTDDFVDRYIDFLWDELGFNEPHD